MSQDLVCSVVVCRGSSRGVAVGPPTLFLRRSTAVPWGSLPGPTGVPQCPMWRQPLLCACWSRDVVRALRSCSYITLMCDHVKLRILTCSVVSLIAAMHGFQVHHVLIRLLSSGALYLFRGTMLKSTLSSDVFVSESTTTLSDFVFSFRNPFSFGPSSNIVKQVCLCLHRRSSRRPHP